MAMKTIQLTKGKEAIIDDSMFDVVSSYSWHTTSKGYARHDYVKNNVRGSIYMHRMIISAKSKEQVDHINGDKLDNRKENLRICTPSQNCANRKVKITSKSGYKGVHKSKGKYWTAYIGINKKVLYLGSFEDKDAAAMAYNKAALEHHGSYAQVNVLTKYNKTAII